MKSVVDRGFPSRLKGAPFTSRERGVLGMVARGLTSEDIAYKLSISERTVHFISTRCVRNSARESSGGRSNRHASWVGQRVSLNSCLPRCLIPYAISDDKSKLCALPSLIFPKVRGDDLSDGTQTISSLRVPHLRDRNRSQLRGVGGPRFLIAIGDQSIAGVSSVTDLGHSYAG